MTVLGTLFRFALGRRPPTTARELTVPGLAAPVTVRRDKWGVPHIDAQSDADAWFGVGFCHGQDRAFQLETLLRLCRGTLAEMVGPEGLSADRMSRRVGFRRAAEKQLPVLDADVRAALDGYARGATAGATLGLPDKPHEFAILGGTPTPWDAADVLAFLKLQSFFLPSNWDVELARLRTLRVDGPEAVRALDPTYPDWHPVTVEEGGRRKAEGGSEPDLSAFRLPPSALLIDRLAADLAAFERFAPPGGGSNNWAISGSRTLSGKPLLASDPHLAPHIPPAWYLAHVRTPRWAAAGATFAGAPGFPIGHNGHACWGVTAGLTDTTDLVLETLGPDGRTVKQPDGTFAPCEVVREVIRVKGRADVVEEIPVTPRGPVVSPMFPGLTEAVSLRASWLDPRPLRGFMDTHMARDFETFRRCFEKWPVLPLNVVYADAGGTVGWQLVGDVPRRQSGANGTIPLPADAPGNAWDGVIPFDEMPFAANPAEGFIATANNPPGAGPFVGTDFVDGYRAKVIREELAKHPVGWTVADCMKLQQNLRSAPWAEMRDIVLSIGEGSRSEERGSSEDARVGLDLLRGWDGVVAADSPAAAVYELLVAELCLRVAKAHAPKSWAAMVGGDGAGPLTHNLFGDRRVGHLVRLLKGGRGKAEGGSDWSSPPSPFRLPPSSVADALGAVVRYLKRKHGPGPAWWHWGDIRPLVLEHPVFGKQRGLKHIFNRGPFPVGGDQNTVSQAGTRPAQPTAPTHNMAGLRAVFDPADWENCRFVLAGGQSGNPTDRHYDDLLAVWRAGGGVPIPWSPEAVLRASVAALRLTPDSD